jgi:hypothetical protein
MSNLFFSDGRKFVSITVYKRKLIIIEAHEGKIWANNNSDGKGATFA